MQTKKLILISCAAASVILAAGGAGYAYRVGRQQIDTIAELNRACHRSKDKDGYGNVTIAGGNFANQKGTISVDCKIRLKPGSTLQLRKVHLKTKDFVIFDFPKQSESPETQKASHVILDQVELNGGDANFQINLGNTASTAVVSDSRLDYAKSLVVGTGEGDSDTKASLVISRNTMRSKGRDGKGVILVTTGRAIFTDNKFEVNDSVGTALLLGDTCEFKNNTNANDRCHGDQEVL